MQSAVQRRAQRALERQLEYQRGKANAVRGQEATIVAEMVKRAAAVRAELSKIQAIASDARVLEVGSGAHGLIFFFEAGERIGVDPLADHYRDLFPVWQKRARTIAAYGEELPFDDSSFDVVLSDNVVDHAESPQRIVGELARVLKPGGMLYFTVNTHHPIYHIAATAHAAWRALGIRFEIAPFADHTVHLTTRAARQLFDGLPLRFVHQSHGVEEAKQIGRTQTARHLGDRLKRYFFKNARWKVIAVKIGGAAGRSA